MSKERCQTCGHLKEVHGTNCQGFKFAKDGKGFGICHCEIFQNVIEVE